MLMQTLSEYLFSKIGKTFKVKLILQTKLSINTGCLIAK